jgi:Ca2+-binding RTX toxin-like protein
MAIFHIKANDGSSKDIIGADAFAATGPGTLIVDANAFLISQSSGDGARLGGSWGVTINGQVRGNGIGGGGFEGLYLTSTAAISTVTVGSTGDVFGTSSGIQLDGSGTITNFGKVGGFLSIFVAAQAHIANAGTLTGDVILHDFADTFTDFIKVGSVIKNGVVAGLVDLAGGADHFNGGSHAETVIDGGGADSYKFGGGNDTYLAVSRSGTAGHDTVDGGKGRDTYNATGATFTVLVNLDTHAHHGLAAQFAQGADVGDVGNTDKVIGFENARGGSAADLLIGSRGANSLIGGAGPDELVGLGGRDVLTGGTDNDIFFFDKLADSGTTKATRDVITDFYPSQDRINLVKLEHSVGHHFQIINSDHFTHHAGQVRETFAHGDSLLAGDTNGDGKADFSILVKGHVELHFSDFVL